MSHDTVRFRFKLPRKTPVLGLPVGKHFKLFAPNRKGKIDGQWNGHADAEACLHEIERKYTPCSSDVDTGYVDLVIKVYKGASMERFPDGGKMSQYLDSLKVGDAITVSGPWGMIEYLGNGALKVGKELRSCARLGMIAGGTGITPMLQIISAILKNSADPTVISLLYANKTESDILLRGMLEGLREMCPDRFKLWYTLDRPPKGWIYSIGFIDEAMIKEHMPPPGPDTLVLMCGPPPMVKCACIANLDALGYDKKSQAAF